MKPRPSKGERRSRRPRHWVVGVCLVFIASVWLASGWFVLYCEVGEWLPFVALGRFGVIRFDSSQNWRPPTLTSHEFGPFYWGFQLGRDDLVVPLWFPFLAIASIGVVREVLWRRRKPEVGHCSCGYDRAGLPMAAPCPECGRPSVSRPSH